MQADTVVLDAEPAPAEPAPATQPVMWNFPVDRAPDELSVRERVQPVLQLVTNDPGIPSFFAALPSLVTVHDLRNGITKPDIKAAARGKLKRATLKALANLLEPGGGFDWPAGEGLAGKKRPGGNGNNMPRSTLEEQLAEEGVQPLNPSTFCWGASVFEGVPKKGEAPLLNPYVPRLFDNTFLAQQKARAS